MQRFSQIFALLVVFAEKACNSFVFFEENGCLWGEGQWLGLSVCRGFYLDCSNLGEKLCDEWVLSASVCVARSPVDFCSATTEAERRPLVFSVPIPLRTQRAKAAQEVRGTSVLRGPKWNVDPRDTKLFCPITETITRTPHLIYHPRYINLNKLLKPFDDVFFVCRI